MRNFEDFHQQIYSIEHLFSSRASNKFEPTQAWFAEGLRIPRRDVRIKYISANKQTKNRLGEVGSTRLILALLPDEELNTIANRVDRLLREAEISAETIVLATKAETWAPRRIFHFEGSEVAELFAEAFPGVPTTPIPSMIIRSTEAPPHYRDAVTQLLTYLGRILDHKFPDDRSRVTVSRKGELITLAVQPPEGRREETEQVIDDYARVLQGGMAPEDFLDDKGEVERLKFELELLQSRLDSERKTTKLQEGRIRVLQRNLEDLQKRNRQLLPPRGLGSITIDIGDKYYVSGQAGSIGRGAQTRSSRMNQSRPGDR